MYFPTYKCPRCGHEEEICILDVTAPVVYKIWCYRCYEMGDSMVEMRPKEKTDATL